MRPFHPATRCLPGNSLALVALIASICVTTSVRAEQSDTQKTIFFERRVRPILVQHCYECHSEKNGEQQGGLLLDRESGWLKGGETGKSVIPGEVDASLLIKAVRYDDEDFQMPPDGRISDDEIAILESWIKRGAPGPAEDMGETEFSRLGDQEYLFSQASDHWAFKPAEKAIPPREPNPRWNRTTIDRFVANKLRSANLTPGKRATPSDLLRRLHFDLTGLPPSYATVRQFKVDYQANRHAAIDDKIQELLASVDFGTHFARLWLDVVRYADTDSAYRADTKTPHYFPFAFSYRDYVVSAFNQDKPYDQFLREQFAADLIGFKKTDPEIAALGFFGVGPHASRSPAEALDDWIDLTTRGLMGITVACARCHDHKYEPVPTVDYYSLRGVFASLDRPNPLDEKKQPLLTSYVPSDSERADFDAKYAAIQKKMDDSAGQKARNNNRPISIKIRDTELAELLLYHPGGPARAMVITEKKRKPASFVFVRGDPGSRGKEAPARFLKILDPAQKSFDASKSGRLDLVQKIVAPNNPLTARVYVNRVWGFLMGSHLVETPSDFGLQGAEPSHQALIDWLATDFVESGWSTKHLVKQIVLSETYQLSSQHIEENATQDQTNRLLWRANRKHLSIEALRDSLLSVSRQMEHQTGGHPAPLWGQNYTRRRAIYGFINRFNLDPTLRAFDFPAPMQTQPDRGESIVAPQALFLMNSAFVADQAKAITQLPDFQTLKQDSDRVHFLFRQLYQRDAVANEITRVQKFIEYQAALTKKVKQTPRFNMDPWPMVAQSLMMSNEFQYVD